MSFSPKEENAKGLSQKDYFGFGSTHKHRWSRWLIPTAGFLSLIWFLVRVLPKPSRVTYPCQRVAVPLAGTFLFWIAGGLASLSAFHKGLRLMTQSRRTLALACLGFAAVCGGTVLVTMSERPALADNPVSNEPIGVAKGLYPGRVVWTHEPDATDWPGPGNGSWWEGSHTNQTVVDTMMRGALHALSGKQTDKEAWDAFFRYFNRTHGDGDIGYRAGEKVVIKVNLVGCIIGSWGAVDPSTYDMVRRLDYMNTSPQMMIALLRQLVYGAGVPQADISIGDPLSLFPNQYYDMCHREFPDVHFMDHEGGNTGHPRRRVKPSSVPFYWSSRPADKTEDYVPDCYAEAKYLINMANFKAHTSAGVTLCAKNHYGSLLRIPNQKDYYDMHESLAFKTPGMGHYRALVDLIGHAHLGGKTMLYLIDGLYSGVHPVESSPRKWNLSPFNGDWTSSLFASQDPVAIDSVAFDFLWAEWEDHPHKSGTHDYLHEAALAENPPSGTFYDPNHATNVSRLASLGVHEHWNDPQNKQYSRNLALGRGIELVQLGPDDLP